MVISELWRYQFPGGRHHEQWQGYATAAGLAELLERYRALVDALIDSRALAGFCYTQLTDVQQERNGLLTADREPKIDLALIRRITRRPPVACSRKRSERTSMTTIR